MSWHDVSTVLNTELYLLEGSEKSFLCRGRPQQEWVQFAYVADSFNIFNTGTVPQKTPRKKNPSFQTCLWTVVSPRTQMVHSFKPQSIGAEKPGKCSMRNVFLCYFYSAESSWSRLQTATFLLGELTMTHIQARKPGAIEQFQSHAWRLFLKEKKNKTRSINSYLLKLTHKIYFNRSRQSARDAK